ncbi:MAG TPA: C1 family peptidase [Acidimicrobiales bacterium]
MTVDVARLQGALDRVGARWQAAEQPAATMGRLDFAVRLGFVPGPGRPSLAARELAARTGFGATSGADDPATPAASDWRSEQGHDWVTPVKDQGDCGSCVAFGSTAAVEAACRIAAATPSLDIDLSEADLFYCVAGSQGRTCDGPAGGWWPEGALDAYRDVGVPPESCFPYVAGDQRCHQVTDPHAPFTKITGWKRLHGVGAGRAWIAEHGPVVACLSVYDDFRAYSSGVYHHVDGDLLGGHCVCLVGFDHATECWIAKNSWGTGWGDGGFFRIGYGQCGIDQEMWAIDGVVAAA